MAAASISIDLERHVSAIIVIVDIYPQMMREMIINFWPPGTISQLVQNVQSDESHPFTRSLNNLDKTNIKKINTEGYSRCDVSLLYKLIRHFGLVEAPTRQWGNRPSVGDINRGDDVERMKRNRNDIFHRPRGCLSEGEQRAFFHESEEIAQRIDDSIGRPANGYNYKLQNLKIHSVTSEKYIQILEKYNDLQERFQNVSGNVNVDLYYGSDIAVKFEPENVEDPSGVTQCSLYVRDPNMDIPQIIEKLDEVKQKLNERNFDIKIQGAENKCLLVHITIYNKCFTAKELLHKAIRSFFQTLFRLTSLDKILRSPVAVVLVESDNIYGIDTTEESFDDLYQTDHILKLDVSVQNNVFQSDVHLYQHVNEVCNEIVHLTDAKIPTNGSSLGVVMTVQKNNGILDTSIPNASSATSRSKGILDTSIPNASSATSRSKGILDTRIPNTSSATSRSKDSHISLKMSEFSDISPRPRSPHLKEELCNCYGDIDNELNKCHDRMDRYKKKIHDRMDKHEKKLKRLSNEIASMLSILDRHIPLKITEFSDKSPGSRLLHLIEKLYNWIEEKDNVVKELNDLADNLDEHFNRISKANIVGPVASIVGFGNAGARGATVSEYVTTDAVLSKNRRKSVEIILKIYNYQVESLKKECVELGELLKQHGNIEESFPIWNCFWAKLVIGEAALAKNIGWDIISRTVSNSLRVASYADDTILEGARAGVKTFKTVGSTAGRGLHIADGGFGILLLPIDIYTLVYSSIDDPKTNPHKASEGIRKTAAKLTKECPSKEEIEVMIDKTLFILINDMQ